MAIKIPANPIVDPTQMSDAQATQMGYKTYIHGTTYNSGISPTIATDKGVGVVRSSSFVPYQTQDGGWRMTFNFHITLTSVTSAGVLFDGYINGVVWKAGVGVLRQAASALDIANSEVAHARLYGGQNWINIKTTSVTDEISISGDAELNGKPTWAY